MATDGNFAMTKSARAGHHVTISILLASTLLGGLLVATLILCVWWAVYRIDFRSLQGEKASLAAAFAEELQRMPTEQNSSAEWDDAVVNLRQSNLVWIEDNLAEWMSEFFGHDRVYVVAPNGSVIRAASNGEYAGTTFAPADVGVLLPRLFNMRERMAEASAGNIDSTTAIKSIEVSEAERLSNGEIAFISIRPILPTTDKVTQAPGTEYLLASIKLIDQELLDTISNRLGIADFIRVPYPQSDATVTLRNANGLVLGYLSWTPSHPAAAILIETAPATLTMLIIGLGSFVTLLTWVRITSIKLAKSREDAAYLAMHDPLTGAANRILFDLKLDEAVRYQYLGRAKVLVVAVDIDHFKEVNDTMGHAAGDQLLSQVTERLKFELGEEATLGRLGGDEFAIVQPAVVSEGQALWICQRLNNALEQPFALDNSSVKITFSLGMALEDGATCSPSEILRRADVALYAAKNAGRDCFRFYSPEMDESRRDKRTLELELRDALVSGDSLYLAYQPVFTACSGEIAGAEALVRWNHPTRGIMPPERFIRLAEETGIIDQLGLWVLQEACRAAVRLHLPAVAVNVSPIQFRDEFLAAKIFEVLQSSGLPASRLEVEITEGILLQNTPTLQRTLRALRDAGVQIALDDFGTGYSSISYLRSHAIDRLKIDQSLTRLVAEDQPTARIVHSIIEMAEALGMSVSAEGVEDEAQRRTLVQMGCSHLQGFLFSAPINETALGTLLSQQQSRGPLFLFNKYDAASG